MRSCAPSGSGARPERPLRILQVNTFDVGGGAARVAWSLFAAYRARGHRSWLAVGQRRSRDPDVLLVPNEAAASWWNRTCLGWQQRLRSRNGRGGPIEAVAAKLLGGLAHPWRSVAVRRGLEDFDFPGTRRLLGLAPGGVDVLHGHNLHGGYFDLRRVPWLSQQVPVVLTLHDAWLLTGHCAHSFECERWRTGCGRCPDLAIYPSIRRDATRANCRRKRALYARSRLRVATPSEWLMRRVEQSAMAGSLAETRVIPNGVDRRVFRPAPDRAAARAALGLPDDALVLLAAAERLRQNPWKDYDTLQAAVAGLGERVRGRPLVLLAVGDEGPPGRLGRAEVRFVPYDGDPARMAGHYRAADLYVHAARVDTFPNTVIEAMACGTPVVATALGGIPEQIDDGETGFLVPPRDPAALARTCARLLEDVPLRREVGRRAADVAGRRFDLARQVDAYLGWYDELRATRERAAR